MKSETYYQEIKITKIRDKSIIQQIADKHVYLPGMKKKVAEADVIECHFLFPDYAHLAMHKEGIFFLIETAHIEALLMAAEQNAN
jgi:hypothetical protein